MLGDAQAVSVSFRLYRMRRPRERLLSLVFVAGAALAELLWCGVCGKYRT